MAREKSQVATTTRTRVPKRDQGAEPLVVVMIAVERRKERRGGVREPDDIRQPRKWEDLMSEAKPKSFAISKEDVWKAYKRVRANKGAAGVDGESITEFEKRLEDNLYKIWNRLSSGSYFPPAVLAVRIPKADGGERKLGIPTVGDRVAQMVVKMKLEPKVDPLFHEDSYGYRPNKSAVEAVIVSRQRCWDYNWVVDLDIKGFFDNINHELMMRAVRKHAEEPWVVLQIERWLKAKILDQGEEEARETGTPQGGVISPLLANLYLHYAFDEWMKRENPRTPFERYADDIIVHCTSQKRAERLMQGISQRFRECYLELHPSKTKLVYCKDKFRKSRYQNEKFDFLGFTYRPRRAINRKGEVFLNFSPAVSERAIKKIRERIRSWDLHRQTGSDLEEIAKQVNPTLQGWLQYYSTSNRSVLTGVLRQLDDTLARWARRKYKKLRGKRRQSILWVSSVRRYKPGLFAHWRPRTTKGSLMGAV